MDSPEQTHGPQGSGSENVFSPPRPGSVPRVWGNIPAQNRTFTGREEQLTLLRSRINTRAVAAVLPYAMHGLGGVGKTQIAIEYTYRYQQDYDVIWWIAADQEPLIESSIASLAPHLDLVSGTGVGQEADAVLDSLRRGDPYDRWLLIFDNAGEPASIQRFLLNGPGHTLITSLNPAWDDLAEPVHVDVFTRVESIEFLGRRLPGIEEADSDALAEQLGDLPLALEQAAALQAATGMPVAEYLELLKVRASELLSHPGQSLYPLPLEAAWGVSFTQLKQNFPDAVDLLRCCAFFGPQPIPRDVLREGRDVVSDSLSAVLQDPIKFSKAIGRLGRYSLARVDTLARTLQVHRLVQALVREDLSSVESEESLHDVQRLLATATPSDPDASMSWHRFAELLPHYAPANLTASRESDVRHSIRSVIRYHYMTGDFHAALQLAEQALKEWSQDPDTAPTDLLAVRRHLGTVLRALGRYQDAFEVNAAAMAEASKQLGPEHDETLRVTNSHGADLRAAGDFQAAYALDEDSVRRHLTALGERDRRTLRAQNNLSLDQALLGRFQAARQLGEHVYQIGLEVYGSESHLSMLASLESLGRYVRLCGDYAEARFLAEDTYAALCQRVGPNHPVTLRAARGLIVAERLASGGTEETAARAADLLALHEQLHGARHPSTVAAATALVNVWRDAGHLDSAIPLAESIVDRCPDVYGPDHPNTHGCRGNLALLRRLSEDPLGGKELHEASADRLNALLGSDHYYTLLSVMGLASDLAALGDIGEAKALGEDVVARLRRVLGEDHPITLAAASNLALDLRALGLEADADQLAADTFERYNRTLGGEHVAARAAFDSQRLDCGFDPSPT